jgi:hypothetical protein
MKLLIQTLGPDEVQAPKTAAVANVHESIFSRTGLTMRRNDGCLESLNGSSVTGLLPWTIPTPA